MKTRFRPSLNALKVTLPALLLLIILGWLLSTWYYTRLLADARSEVEGQLVPYGNALVAAVNQRAALVEGLVAFSRSHPSQAELHQSFDAFSAGLVSTGFGVRAVQIFAADSPVLVYPTAGNEATLGRTLDDLINDERPSVRADVQRAIQTGQITVSGPYELRQGGLGLVIRQAVRDGEQLWGIVVVVIDLPPLLSASGLEGNEMGLAMGLRDQAGQMLYGENALFDQQPVIYPVDLPEGGWQLGGIPQGGWDARVRPALTQFRLFIALFICLIGGLIFIIASSQHHLRETVDQRTAELGSELARNKRAFEALQASENKFRSLAETARDIILIHDLQGNILYLNRAGLQICGLTEQDIASGVNLTRFVPPQYHAMLAQHAAERRENLNGPRLYEMEILDYTGRLLPIEVSSAPILQNGAISGIVVLARDMTERKKAQQELQVALVKYHTLFDILPLGVTIMDAQGKIVETNTTAKQLLGFAEDGQASHKLATGEWKAIRADGSPAQSEEYASTQAMRRKTAVKNVETGIQKPTGEVIWISTSATPIPLEGYSVVVAYNDVSERIRTEKERAGAIEALRESEERFRALYEQAPLAYQSLDFEGRIIEVNQTWLEMFQFTREEALGRWFYDFLIPEDRELFQHHLKTFIAQGKAKGVEFRALRKDGSQIIVAIDGRIGKTMAGEFKQTHCILNDITARRQVEDEIRRLNARLEQRVAERTAELELSNHELEAFAYSVSHDLRTPLRAIDGFSRIIQEEYSGQLDHEADRLIKIIRDSTQKMDQLITDLLALSQVNASGLAFKQVVMGEMVQALYQELASAEVRESFTFTLLPLPDGWADPILIRQVWSNLLSNAIKYTLPQAERRIEVGFSTQANAYYVKDSGVGFNAEYSNKLFGLFQRLHRSNEFEGTGVGLAIVQRIIQRHRGRVWGVGAINQGATFYFSLPGRPDPTDDQAGL